MKIAHEAPIASFKAVQGLTDYDYCLVHLMDRNEKYKDMFLQAKKDDREILLDNSIFELGAAYDSAEFAYWIVTLQPDWYIIPDVLENATATVASFKKWQMGYGREVPGKRIAVAQGSTMEELVWCYREIEPHVDKVAISFDYSFFHDIEKFGILPTKFHYWMYGRDAMVHYMLANGIINTDKPHHLLGCSLPQEFASYQKMEWIDSLDTSNPVVAGIKGISYNGRKGLEDKPSQKLHELIDWQPTNIQWLEMKHNIEWFRRIACG